MDFAQAQLQDDDLDFLKGVDFSTPNGTTPEGKPYFMARCRLQFTAPQVRSAALLGATGDGFSLPELTEEQRALIEERCKQFRVQLDPGIEIDPDASGDDGSEDEQPADDVQLSADAKEMENFRLEGVASSTSVDFYTTEMSLQALQSMAKQMNRGVPYLPRHQESLWHSVEWDGVMGQTVFADVLSADKVMRAFDDGEDQYVLRVVTEVFGYADKADKLAHRLSRGQTIGQSIGGWFTELMFVTDGEGEIERIVVMGVELDHLALTRAPANPDSIGLDMIRSKAGQMYRDAMSQVPWESVSDGLQFLLRHAVGIDEIRSVDGGLYRLLDSARSGEARSLSMDDFLDQCRDDEGVALRHLIGVKNNGDGTVSVVLAIEDDEEDMSQERTTEGEDGRTTESDGVPESLDSNDETTQDATEVGAPEDGDRDALGSAPVDDDTAAGESGGAPEERDMPENDDTQKGGLTIDAIRSLFSEQMEPVTRRLDALEGAASGDGEDTNTDTDDRASDFEANDEMISRLKARAEAAEKRQQDLEAALASRASAPNRIGRHRPLAAMAPSKRQSEIRNRLDAARNEGTAMAFANVVDRNISKLADVRDTNGKPAASASDLEVLLSEGLNAAIADGLITNPNDRASWA